MTQDFPADGEYVINIANMAQAIWVYNMEFENHRIVTLDHRKIYATSVGGEEDMKAIDQRQDPAVDAINKRLKDIHFNATAGTPSSGGDLPAAEFRRRRRPPCAKRSRRRRGSSASCHRIRGAWPP